ncbi:MAG: hypothetical protein ABH914_02670 [Candidatus Omnitrophota bacterium]
MNKKGIILIVSYMVIGVLIVLGIGFIARTMTEANAAQRYAESVHAFWASEAAISQALTELRADPSVTGGSGSLSTSNSRYSFDVEDLGDTLKVTAHGFVPASGAARIERVVEVIMSNEVPDNFYDNAIYSAGDVDFNGDCYTVDGNVIYANENDIEHPENITGTLAQEAEDILPRFAFEGLLEISQDQKQDPEDPEDPGNVYDDARLKLVQQGKDFFPSSFWFTEPTDPEDPTTGVPNIIYVMTDLQLNGEIGDVGGFFVVVGDVITNPDEIEDLTINGRGLIDGVVYTRGTFRVNGGGGGDLNVVGGIWAGEEARLNGSVGIAYNESYMSAIEGLNIEVDLKIVSWRDTQNPLSVSP